MRTLAAIMLVLMFTTPAAAGVIWDESVNGELSHSPSTPTLLPVLVGSNIVNGTMGNFDGKARDYLRFIVPADHQLISINLLAYSPDNTGFTAINSGVHSYFPLPETEIYYAAGIHLFGSDVGQDLMDLFMTRAVTSESLGVAELEPGSWCMVLQQTGVLLTSYSLEFVMTGPVPARSSTWGSIKSLYR